VVKDSDAIIKNEFVFVLVDSAEKCTGDWPVLGCKSMSDDGFADFFSAT
jgi:hypothetical protein